MSLSLKSTLYIVFFVVVFSCCSFLPLSRKSGSARALFTITLYPPKNIYTYALSLLRYHYLHYFSKLLFSVGK